MTIRIWIISIICLSVLLQGSLSFATTNCSPTAQSLQGQANEYIINAAINTCKESLKSETCKRYFYANPKRQQTDIKTCSQAEVTGSTADVIKGTRQALAQNYGKKVDAFLQTLKNLPNIRIPTDLATLTFGVATVMLESFGKLANVANIATTSIEQCFDKNEICLGKMLKLTEAQTEKLKIKTQGFDCLKPSIQASLVTLAIVEASEIAGLTPEQLLLQSSFAKIAKKLTKNNLDDVEGEVNADPDSTTVTDTDKSDTPEQRRNAKVAVARSPARQAFLDELTDAKQKEFFSQINTAEFSARAAKDLSAGKKTSRSIYFIRENAYLKNLNEETNDFDFVTGLNIFDQMNFNHEIDLLLKRSENADLFKLLSRKDATSKYRDGKTFQGAFSLEGMTALQEERLVKLINDACTNNFNTATQKFAPLHRKTDDDNTSDIPENLASAFKCGVAYNHISAGHAARSARDESHVGPTELADYRKQGKASAPLVAKANAAYDRSKNLETEFSKTDWNKLWNPKKQLFSLDVFEALRKSGSPHELVYKLKEYTGVKVSKKQAAKIFHYKTSIDTLSPNFLDEGAEILSFDDAHFGGLKSDFPNVGAKNLEALAEALKNAKPGNNGNGLNYLPQQLKKAEESVTKYLAEQKKALHDLVHKVYQGVTCMKTSGDDASTHFGCAVTRELKQSFVDQASNDPLIKSTRYVFFSEHVVEADRMPLSNHGEFLDKEIRSSLRKGKVFNKEELKNLTLALDMQGDRLWNGKIDLIIADSEKLSPAQRKALDIAIDKALKTLADKNAGKSEYKRASRLSSKQALAP